MTCVFTKKVARNKFTNEIVWTFNFIVVNYYKWLELSLPPSEISSWISLSRSLSPVTDIDFFLAASAACVSFSLFFTSPEKDSLVFDVSKTVTENYLPFSRLYLSFLFSSQPPSSFSLSANFIYKLVSSIALTHQVKMVNVWVVHWKNTGNH